MAEEDDECKSFLPNDKRGQREHLEVRQNWLQKVKLHTFDAVFSASKSRLLLLTMMILVTLTMSSDLFWSHLMGGFINREDSYSPRQVKTSFLQGKPWKVKSNERLELVYPMKLPFPDGFKGIIDVTRYYPQGDSAEDFPKMKGRGYPNLQKDPHCIPVADWQTTFHPVCNEIHATDLADRWVDESFKFLGNGFWRNALQYKEIYSPTTTVWKIFRLTKGHNFEAHYIEGQTIDAVAMERLTSSPYVLNIYSFCGMTAVVEQKPLNERGVIEKRLNELNSTERLQMAVRLSQGLADVHGIDGDQPSLAHNDIKAGNLLFTQDDVPIWHDFNVAVLLKKHNETNEVCPFQRQPITAKQRAPEEGHEREYRDVTEKADIYKMGNILFWIAVGRLPWKFGNDTSLSNDQLAELKSYNGTLPTVPDEVRESSDPSIQAILEAMYQCYRFDPAERPSASAIAGYLSNALSQV